MKFLIACDKFKGSISALAACRAIAQGIRSAYPNAACTLHPMADGGDGSLAILENYLDGQSIQVDSEDPLGRPLQASYLLHQGIAYIELAQASGIALLATDERNPLVTTTFGTGILIKDALHRKIKHLVLLLGGSATNDAGIGIAAALGFQFFDQQNQDLLPIGENLIRIKRIAAPKDLPPFDLEILYDVSNPFFGANGAAQVYAKQKGADEAAIQLLDTGLKNIATVIERQFHRSIEKVAGAGSAGGIGGGLHGMLNATMKQGFAKLSAITGLEKAIAEAEVIITGEGKLDHQSLQGKVIGGMVNLCKNHPGELYAFVGVNSLSEEELKAAGISGVFTVRSQAESEEDAMERAGFYLHQLAAKIGG